MTEIAAAPTPGEPAAPPPAEGAAAPGAPEEEVVAAAIEPPPAEAPAAARGFKIVSKSGSNDFIALDGTMSGSVDLGTGRDAVALPGNKADYSVARQGNGWTVSHDVDGAKVKIELSGVEWLQFDDGVARLDWGDTHAMTGYQIVKAVMGAPRGLNHVFSVAEDLDRGQSQDSVISHLMQVMRPQFNERFSAPHDTQDGITQHYVNILGRQPEWDGLKGWLKAAPHMTREQMLSGFALGSEATSAAVNEVGQGAPFEPALFV